MAAEKTATALFEEQKRRHAALAERRTRAEGHLQAERQALREAQQEALSLFGTDDLGKLRELFAQLTQANDQSVVEFVMALDDLEQGLTSVERQLGQ